MPFEPLRTDEKVTGSKLKREQDMDSAMLVGCTGFVLCAILTYFLSVWPFFAFREHFTYIGLGIALALALVPSALFSWFAARKFGMAPAFGCIAGAAACAVFLFLRLKQMELAFQLPQFEDPEYPLSFMFYVPLVVLLALALTSLAGWWSAPENRKPKKGSPKSREPNE
jgi:hypothetical protein